MLRLGRSRVAVTVETVMLVDSLQMTEQDRARVAERCLGCSETEIVVTHGTDTMVETAALLRGTGPARPSCSPAPWCPMPSAAPTACSISAAPCRSSKRSPGVYIAMNGTHFEWDKVRKNRTLGELCEALSP